MFDSEDLKYLEHMEQRLNERMDAQKADLEKRIDIQKADIEKRMDAQKDEILKESMHNMRVIVESDIMPKMNLILDAIQTLHETMVPKSRVDEMEDDILMLKQAYRIMAQDIAELKKAQ